MKKLFVLSLVLLSGIFASAQGSSVGERIDRGEHRKLITKRVDLSSIRSSEDCYIQFKMQIDSLGNVVDLWQIETETNVYDRRIIYEVKTTLKDQLKYEPRKVGVVYSEFEYLRIKISAN